MIHPQDPIYVAHGINSAHIDKLRDISCLIYAVGTDRATVMKKLLDRINSDIDYFNFHNDGEDPIVVSESDFIFTESQDNGQEYVYDSDELGMTYCLSMYTGQDFIRIV